MTCLSGRVLLALGWRRGGIRIQGSLISPASCRFYVAAPAPNAMCATPACPILPDEYPAGLFGTAKCAWTKGQSTSDPRWSGYPQNGSTGRHHECGNGKVSDAQHHPK